MPAPRVLFLSSEVVPFSKSGGLADVAGALPAALGHTGCEVTVATPLYSRLMGDHVARAEPEGTTTIRGAGEAFHAGFHLLACGTQGVETVFVACDPLFGRAGLYGEATDAKGYADYPDNDVRFSVFVRALLAWIKRTGRRYDIVHANDWQTALVCAYLPLLYGDDPAFAGTRTLLTIHNLAYQGVFPDERFAVLGLDASLFAPLSPFEFYEQVNFLKAGIHYACKINTVSQTYAKEIQNDPELGCGLDGMLRNRAADVSGILNGIDTHVWNPSTDTLLKHTYDSTTAAAGKRINKETLLRRARIPSSRWDRPLVGMISRLDAQKGFDLIEEAAAALFTLDFNFVLLGTGAKKYHTFFEKLAAKHPDRVAAFLAFDNELAHLIEAGADLFLMPSRYEPSGLNQMYSLNYGTVPVVRATGGLADTIIDADDDPKNGNGFSFVPYSAEAMVDTLARSLAAFANRDRWRTIQARGMQADFSWSRSAARYKELYEAALKVDATAGFHHH